MEKELLINRSYRMRVYPIQEDGTCEWAVEYPDLPGCVGGGDTIEEAIEMAEDAKRAWIEIALEDGRKIPEPSVKDINDFSGKFTLRLPKILHRDLTLTAEEQGISLNQYLLYLITKNHHQCENNSLSRNEEFEFKETLERKITVNGLKKGWNRSGSPYNFADNSLRFERGDIIGESK